MFTEDYENLLRDVAAWLQGGPSPEDLRYYVSRIPENDRSLVLHAAQWGARELFTRKLQLFQGAGMEWVVREMTESDQLDLIAYFGLYSQDSIARNLQERYPGRVVAIPTGMQEWAGNYIQYWTALTCFLAVPEYEIQLQLRSSLRALRLTPEQREQLATDVAQAFVTEERHMRETSEHAKAEVDHIQSILTRLTFIPADRYDSLLDAFAGYARQLLFFRIRTVLKVEDAAAASGADPEAVLFEQNRFHGIQLLLTFMEADRREWTGEADLYPEMTDALVQATLPSAIFDGTAPSRVSAALSQQPPELQEVFRRMTEDYCSSLPLIEQFFDPFSSRQFYRQVAQCIDEGALQQLVTDVQDSFEASEYPLLQQYARFFYELTHKVLNRA